MGRLKEFEDCDLVLGPGVYALFFYGECVYVGKSKNVLGRIYAHRNMWDRVRQRKTVPIGGRIKPVRFNGVGVYQCKESDLDRVEKAMIEKYRPRHNTQMKPSGKVSLEKAGFDFTTLFPQKALRRV